MLMNCMTIFGMTLTDPCILGLQGPRVKIGEKDFNFHRKTRYVPLRLRSLRVGKNECPGNPSYPHPQI